MKQFDLQEYPITSFELKKYDQTLAVKDPDTKKILMTQIIDFSYDGEFHKFKLKTVISPRGTQILFDWVRDSAQSMCNGKHGAPLEIWYGLGNPDKQKWISIKKYDCILHDADFNDLTYENNYDFLEVVLTVKIKDERNN